MSDELDPSLLRLFAQANEPLPGRQFQARVVAGLRRARTSVDIRRVIRFVARATLSGIATGIAAPFKLNAAYICAMATSAVGLILWISLQSP